MNCEVRDLTGMLTENDFLLLYFISLILQWKIPTTRRFPYIVESTALIDTAARKQNINKSRPSAWEHYNLISQGNSVTSQIHITYTPLLVLRHKWLVTEDKYPPPPSHPDVFSDFPLKMSHSEFSTPWEIITCMQSPKKELFLDCSSNSGTSQGIVCLLPSTGMLLRCLWIPLAALLHPKTKSPLHDTTLSIRCTELHFFLSNTADLVGC